MTSHPPSDERPPEPSQDGNADFVSEQELDAILTQAHTLADKLSVEVGAVGQGEPPAEEKALAAREGEPEQKGLDQELDQLQHLVAETQAELEALDEDRTPSAEVTAANLDSACDSGHGDTSGQARSASETTREPAHGEGSDSDRPIQAAVKTSKLRPGVVGTGLIGLLGASELAPHDDPSGPATKDAAEDAQQPQRGDDARNWVTRVLRATSERLAPITLACSMQLVRALEWLDVPFSGLNGGLRRAIGWIAVATAGTSVVVYVLSLFR